MVKDIHYDRYCTISLWTLLHNLSLPLSPSMTATASSLSLSLSPVQCTLFIAGLDGAEILSKLMLLVIRLTFFGGWRAVDCYACIVCEWYRWKQLIYFLLSPKTQQARKPSCADTRYTFVECGMWNPHCGCCLFSLLWRQLSQIGIAIWSAWYTHTVSVCSIFIHEWISHFLHFFIYSCLDDFSPYIGWQQSVVYIISCHMIAISPWSRGSLGWVGPMKMCDDTMSILWLLVWCDRRDIVLFH